MRNTAYLGNTWFSEAIEGLRSRLPDGWRLTLSKPARARAFQADAQLTVRGSDGAKAVLLVKVKRRVSPRQAADAAAELARTAREGQGGGGPPVSGLGSGVSPQRDR